MLSSGSAELMCLRGSGRPPRAGATRVTALAFRTRKTGPVGHHHCFLIPARCFFCFSFLEFLKWVPPLTEAGLIRFVHLALTLSQLAPYRKTNDNFKKKVYTHKYFLVPLSKTYWLRMIRLGDHHMEDFFFFGLKNHNQTGIATAAFRMAAGLASGWRWGSPVLLHIYIMTHKRQRCEVSKGQAELCFWPIYQPQLWRTLQVQDQGYWRAFADQRHTSDLDIGNSGICGRERTLLKDTYWIISQAYLS